MWLYFYCRALLCWGRGGEDVQVASAPRAELKRFPSAESTCFNGDTNGFAGKKPLPDALCRAGGRHVSVCPPCTPGSGGDPVLALTRMDAPG